MSQQAESPSSEADAETRTPVIAVSAVMPCLNEERTLGACILKAQTAFRNLGVAGEVVVADNGSTDRSTDIAENLGARVVTERRKGYGSALMAGIGVAKGRIIVMADADESYDWLCLGDFVRKIDEGFDLVMGNRFQGGIDRKAMPPLHRYLGNPLLSALARRMYRIPIGDFHCGMRAFTKAAYQKMGSRTSGMEYATEMVVNAAQAGLRIAEIPTPLHPDKRGRPPHLHSFRDGWRHLRFMLTYAPDYLYFVPGILLLVAGSAGMTVLARGPTIIAGFPLGIHFLALASLLTLLGLNVVGFGILAKVINSRRCAIPRRSLLAWALQLFTLERGLVSGLLLMAAGLGVDGMILFEWFARGRGTMDDTVHLAFIASTVLVLGIDVIFGSFLLRMIHDDVGGNPWQRYP